MGLVSLGFAFSFVICVGLVLGGLCGFCCFLILLFLFWVCVFVFAVGICFRFMFVFACGFAAVDLAFVGLWYSFPV